MFNFLLKNKFRNQRMPHQIRYDYQIPYDLKFNITQDEKGWYVIKCKDLPGLVTQAKDQREVNKVINDAILTYFDVPVEEFNGQLGFLKEFATGKELTFA
jgi:predicted RNase H-like HicB family nuclease